ncbi:MAG: glycosyltransferase family 2 protein [Pirellulales bacterium]
MSQSPLFTVGIICFNRVTMVRDAIESALKQEFADFELVLVDDGSTDGSADIIRDYAQQAKVVVREQNGGEMAARNSALTVARGEYVAFLDSDDQWFPWTLATYAEAIERHNRPTIVGGKMFEFRDPGQVNDVEQSPYADSASTCYFTGSHYFGVVSAAIRRSAIDDVGRFVDVRFVGPDADLMFRIGDRPGFVRIESPFTFAYRQHGGNIMANVEMRYHGARQWIESESEGKYPGGAALRAERLRHITLHTRAMSVQCLYNRQYGLAFDLYRRTFRWNLLLRRWAYLASFPWMAICPPLIRIRESYFQRKRTQLSC